MFTRENAWVNIPVLLEHLGIVVFSTYFCCLKLKGCLFHDADLRKPTNMMLWGKAVWQKSVGHTPCDEVVLHVCSLEPPFFNMLVYEPSFA